MSQSESTQTSNKQKSILPTLLSPLKEALSLPNKPYKFFIHSSDSLLEVVVELPSHLTLQEAVRRALHRASTDQPVDVNASNYEIYIPKKNGQPKLDLPSYQQNITLEHSANNIFSIVHVTYEDKQKPRNQFRKSTADLSHYGQNPVPQQEINKSPKSQPKPKNWFLNLFGCA